MLDAAQDRIAEQAREQTVRMADAVRAGGADQRNYERWRRNQLRPAPGPSDGLSGDALEQAIMTLARTNPEYVVVGG